MNKAQQIDRVLAAMEDAAMAFGAAYNAIVDDPAFVAVHQAMFAAEEARQAVEEAAEDLRNQSL